MTAHHQCAENAATTDSAARRVLREMARRRREEARRIGARIAELREHHHWTQPAAAERARVSLRTYQTWEAGDATPRWHNYERLAKAFGVTVDEIISAAPVGSANGVAEQLSRIEAKLDAVLRAVGESEPPDAEAAALRREVARLRREDADVAESRRGAASRGRR